MSVIVQLSRDEVRLCSMLAIERWLETRGNDMDEAYQVGKTNNWTQHQMLAEVRTVCAEWAVAKHYQWSWTVPWWPKDEHKNRKHLPDVGERGEVRTVVSATAISYTRNDTGKLIIGCKVIDEAYFSIVEIYGTFEPNFDDMYLQPNGKYGMPVDQCQS